MNYSSNWTCPTSNQACDNCPQVVKKWDIYRLLEDLAAAKSEFIFPGQKLATIKRLTKAETCWLHLLLFGLNPDEISRHLNRSNLRPELAKSIYRYVEILTGSRIADWAQVRLYLENSGYRIEQTFSKINQTRLIKITVLLESDLNEPADLLNTISQNIKGSFLRLKSYYYEEEPENE